MKTENEDQTPEGPDAVSAVGLVSALIQHQTAHGLSNRAFARRLHVSEGTWSLCRNLVTGTGQKYKLTPGNKTWERLTIALNELREADEYRDFAPSAEIYPVTKLKTIVAAMTGAAQQSQNRLVVYLAPTGGGKSTAARHIVELYPTRAVHVEACETWRSSYLTALLDIAAACGIEVKNLKTTRAAKDKVFEHLEKHAPRLVIDEGHYCGPETLNLLKEVLNKTECTVLLLSIPDLWERMNRSAYAEALQLKRRTFALIQLQYTVDKKRVDGISPRDVETILTTAMPALKEAPQRRDIIAAVQAAANRFGHYDTIGRILTELRHEQPEHLDLDTIQTAITNAQALQG